MRNMKILVIDDNATHRAAAEAQLGRGHSVTTAADYSVELQDREGKPLYEVVLTDLLLPANRNQQGPNGYQYVGQEMPLGIFTALAAAQAGIKLVGLLTDSNHHDHPASASLDAFQRQTLKVNGATVLLSNDTNLVKAFYKDDLSRVMEWGEYFQDRARGEELTVRTKDWKELLERVLAAAGE